MTKQLPDRATMRDQLATQTREYLALQQSMVAAQTELLSATWTAHERGEATWDDLYAVAGLMRESGISGFASRWNDIVPVSWNRAQQYATRGGPPVPPPRRAPAEYLAGTWTADRQTGGACPARGTYVVYELFGQAGELLYVGASSDLAGRLRGHREKPWASARARQARDQIDAEGLEAVAILTKRPPLNKQVTCWGGAPALLAAAEKASVATPQLRTMVRALNDEANAQLMADEIQTYVAAKNTTWARLQVDDPNTAEWLWVNTLAANSGRVDSVRAEQILAEREQAAAVMA